MKRKVLICYTELLHYRIPVLRKLSEYYDLTVLHSGKRQSAAEEDFVELILPAKKVGRFRSQPGLWRLLRKEPYDSVIFFLDLSWPSIVSSFLFCSKPRRKITWGLWRTGKKVADYMRIRFALMASANIFYCTGHAVDFERHGVPSNKIWIARNTVQIESPDRAQHTNRHLLLLIGSLDERKRNDVTIRAFCNVLDQLNPDIKLMFVGEGPAKQTTMTLARSLAGGDRIEFRSGTTDAREIRNYYGQAIASVSFGQAGLSVLQSLAHGVPFITNRNAISGGELENLQDGFNALLCEENIGSLEEAILRICRDSSFAEYLGTNSVKFYKEYCTIEKMVDGFVGAIENWGNFLSLDQTL